MRRSLVAALLVIACPLAVAQAYKWKDAQGVTHYADAPPPGNTRYEKIKTAAGDSAQPAPAPTPTTPPAPAKPAATGNEDTPANRAKLCDQIRKNVQALNTEKNLTMDDGKGGVKPVDDATRQSELKKAQAEMTVYCQA
ncbi:DUF4124 domain-containing protein [Luteibacter anthropi]|uniref:DUF4124 domain-containing protein n=1 Tax=Luteibacter anthropi TaxID=564369 RepID=UPI0020329EBE|nr:DUF4124 domain-containing protein [Luteibacter anthropi]URX61014.1 DUF4124 domain-containing protein [Luteibacter anthropi]